MKDQIARNDAETAKSAANRAGATARTVSDALQEPTTGVFARLDDLERQAEAAEKTQTVTAEKFHAAFEALPKELQGRETVDFALTILGLAGCKIEVELDLGHEEEAINVDVAHRQVDIEEANRSICEAEATKAAAEERIRSAQGAIESHEDHRTELHDRMGLVGMIGDEDDTVTPAGPDTEEASKEPAEVTMVSEPTA